MSVWYGFRRCRASRRSRASNRGSIRMAINSLAYGDFGRPTPRARLSSASVNSGMSEKSIWLSAIGLALFAARLPRADNPNRIFAIVRPPNRVNYEEHSFRKRFVESFEPSFVLGMCRILQIKRFGISENCCCLFKRHAVLFEVLNRLASIPREHIYVYTLIRGSLQRMVTHNATRRAGRRGWRGGRGYSRRRGRRRGEESQRGQRWRGRWRWSQRAGLREGV